MTAYLMRVVATSDHDDHLDGSWLESFDNDANDGRGAAKFTNDKSHALRFESMRAALDAWRSPSTVCPLRTDGKPNRPLTAYTVEIEAAP